MVRFDFLIGEDFSVYLMEVIFSAHNKLDMFAFKHALHCPIFYNGIYLVPELKCLGIIFLC